MAYSVTPEQRQEVRFADRKSRSAIDFQAGLLAALNGIFAWFVLRTLPPAGWLGVATTTLFLSFSIAFGLSLIRWERAPFSLATKIAVASAILVTSVVSSAIIAARGLLAVGSETSWLGTGVALSAFTWSSWQLWRLIGSEANESIDFQWGSELTRPALLDYLRQAGITAMSYAMFALLIILMPRLAGLAPVVGADPWIRAVGIIVGGLACVTLAGALLRHARISARAVAIVGSVMVAGASIWAIAVIKPFVVQDPQTVAIALLAPTGGLVFGSLAISTFVALPQDSS